MRRWRSWFSGHCGIPWGRVRGRCCSGLWYRCSRYRQRMPSLSLYVCRFARYPYHVVPFSIPFVVPLPLPAVHHDKPCHDHSTCLYIILIYDRCHRISTRTPEMCSDTAAQYRTDENDARNWQSTTGNANASTPDTAPPPPRARRIAHTSRMTHGYRHEHAHEENAASTPLTTPQTGNTVRLTRL